MIKYFKVRLEPNNKQNTKLFQCAGTGRWAYNFALAKIQDHYKETGKFLFDGAIRKELTQLKKNDDNYKWLYCVSNNITKQAIKDACNAYNRFFKGVSKFPNFKTKKKSKPSFYNDVLQIKFTSNHVQLEKVGLIKLSETNKIPSGAKYLNPRISFNGLNWYISVGIKVEDTIKPILTNDKLGIDVGVKDLAVISNGIVYKNINKSKRIKKLERRLKTLQRQISKKYRMNKIDDIYIKTKNILYFEMKLRKLYKKLTNIRTDYIHKVSTEIVKTKPSRIVMETLDIVGMMKNKYLSKALAEQKLYEFKSLLKYKCNEFGIEFIEADRWFPSSKTCCECGHVKRKLSLKERNFICEECGCITDRDYNASVNLSRYKLS